MLTAAPQDWGWRSKYAGIICYAATSDCYGKQCKCTVARLAKPDRKEKGLKTSDDESIQVGLWVAFQVLPVSVSCIFSSCIELQSAYDTLRVFRWYGLVGWTCVYSREACTTVSILNLSDAPRVPRAPVKSLPPAPDRPRHPQLHGDTCHHLLQESPRLRLRFPRSR